MAVHRLEDNAVRAIGATQVLTDPSAVVKEFIDNALDANATSVAVELHANTIDIIQVRDNGHGIAPDDRTLVARPNCTSKLNDFDDIKQLGGTTLGFRGQALAAAAEMSGSLTIITRVEGEPVAAALKINQIGEAIAQDRASSPVGTTVRITDFVKHQPVRKQVVLKNAEKCLRTIKRTLQAYAFARPSVRLSLRVLKAKNDKGNWMYAPKPGGSVEDAAFKIVGSACVSQCTWTVIEDHGFTLHAFVPRGDAESVKVSGFGSFVSVDARPVAASRGTLKQLTKIFRDALKATSPAFENIKEPFIYLSVSCPSASYDPNVEPAKDDVLFEDADVIVELSRKLFGAVYPAKAAEHPTQEPEVENGKSVQHPSYGREDDDDFFTSLEPQRHDPRIPARWQAPEVPLMRTPAPTSDLHEPEIYRDEETMPPPAFRTNMYGCDEEDIDFMEARPPTGRTEAEFEELRQARKDITISNPWVLAKMNAPIRRPAEGQNEHGQALGLPTPRPSSPTPPAEDFHASDYGQDAQPSQDAPLIGSQALPLPHHVARLAPASEDYQGALDEPVRRQPPSYDYALSSQVSAPPAGTPLHAIPERRSPQKQHQSRRVNKPFVSPMTDQPPREKVWFDHLEKGSGRPRQRQKPAYESRHIDGLIQQGELGDLIDYPRPLTPPRRNRDIRDFVGMVDMTGDDSAASIVERHNYAPARRSRSLSRPVSGPADVDTTPARGVMSGRGFVPASELAALEQRVGPLNQPATRPSKRRKTGEGHPLREVSGNSTAAPAEEESEQQTADENTTARRRRRTTDGESKKMLRRKSSRLPLERVPKGQGMHNIEKKLTASTHEVSRWAGKMDEEHTLLGWNQPAVDAYDAFSPLPDADGIALKLRELLINRVSDGEMVQDLGVLVQDAFVKHQANVAGTDEVEVD